MLPQIVELLGIYKSYMWIVLFYLLGSFKCGVQIPWSFWDLQSSISSQSPVFFTFCNRSKHRDAALDSEFGATPYLRRCQAWWQIAGYWLDMSWKRGRHKTRGSAFKCRGTARCRSADGPKGVEPFPSVFIRPKVFTESSKSGHAEQVVIDQLNAIRRLILTVL